MCEIEIWLDRQDFEYDLYTLVRAFYPGSRVTAHCVPSMPKEAKSPQKEQVFLQAWCREAGVYVRYEKEGQEPVCREAAMDVYQDRRETKSRLKQLLYQVLHIATGRTLIWGNLTGIRPVKLAAALLEESADAAQAQARMEEKYYLDPSKSSLCVEIALREKEVLRDLDPQEGYSLYVGIPFCPSICMYCSFSSYPLDKWKKRIGEYVDTLCREVRIVGQLVQRRKLHTVYIGGGTPTTLEPAQMERVLVCLEECFPMDGLREFTVEAGRPDSITREKLEVFRRHGVTRISVNPQTMDQKTLDLIGRRHTVEDTRAAYALVRELGFDNVNMDLIVGLPGEGVPEIGHTLSQIRKLGPDSLTVHSLAVKRAARLRLFSEEHPEMSFENNSQIMAGAERQAREMGLVPYYLYRQKNMAGNLENVGYARPDKICLYNILMMEEKQTILALGAGGSSKFVTKGGRTVTRVENVKDVTHYLERLDEMIERKKNGMKIWDEEGTCL